MALLHMLRELSSRHRWQLTVAHFNHQLRGRSSDADEKLVRQTAAALRLPFAIGGADVKQFARKSKGSIEMAARRLRHEFFARAARERKIRVVALAHHPDDQVELFFLRILRGAGGEGLGGMKWQSPSPVDSQTTLIRPLLDSTREELRRLVRENKIRFREDATNARLKVPRNRVRNELLPLLRRHYQPALAKIILRLMEIVGAEAEVVGGMAERWLREGTGRSFPKKGRSQPAPTAAGRREEFEKLPVAVQRRILQVQLAGLGVPVEFDLIEQLRRAANRFVSVSFTSSVSRDAAGGVNLHAPAPVKFNAHELAVDLAGRAGDVEFGGAHLSWRFEPGTGVARSPERKTSESFDADRVGGRITLRHWRPGDRLQPLGLKSAAKLQDLFTNRKIPRVRRHGLIVATAGNGRIFWVEGLPMAEEFKLTPATRR